MSNSKRELIKKVKNSEQQTENNFVQTSRLVIANSFTVKSLEIF